MQHFSSCESKMPWARFEWPMAISCVALIVPAFLLQSPSIGAVTLTSLFSDAIYTGKSSIWHPLDRSMAKVALVLVSLRILNSVGWIGIPTMILPPVLCYAGSCISVARHKVRAYYTWHILWHMGCVYSGSLLAFIESRQKHLEAIP